MGGGGYPNVVANMQSSGYGGGGHSNSFNKSTVKKKAGGQGG